MIYSHFSSSLVGFLPPYVYSCTIVFVHIVVLHAFKCWSLDLYVPATLTWLQTLMFSSSGSLSLQGCENVAAVAKQSAYPTPYILVSGENYVQTFLVVDKTIISEIKSCSDIPFGLMAAYFVFNICYPRGCTNLFSFLEVITLNYPSTKVSATVKYFLSGLYS